jgi:hypothetical protein
MKNRYLQIIIGAMLSFTAAYWFGWLFTNLFFVAALGAVVVLFVFASVRRTLMNYLLPLSVLMVPLTHIIMLYRRVVSLAHIVIGVVSVVIVVQALANRRIRRLTAYEVSFVLFVLYLGITILWARDPRNSLVQYFSVIVATAMLLAARQIPQCIEIRSALRGAIVAAGVLVSILAILQINYGERFFPSFFSSDVPVTVLKAHETEKRIVRSARATGTFLNPNSLGVFLLFPLVMLGEELKKRKTAIHAGLFILLLCGVLVTFSRGAYILAILGLVLIYLCDKHDVYFTVNVVALMVIFFVVYEVFLADYVEVVKYMFSRGESHSLDRESRYSFWVMSLKLMNISPIWGLGYGNVGYILEHAFLGFDPHSSYLRLLLDHGIVGLSLFMAFLTSVLKKLMYYGAAHLEELRPAFIVFVLYSISLMIDGFLLDEPFIYLLPAIYLTTFDVTCSSQLSIPDVAEKSSAPLLQEIISEK